MNEILKLQRFGAVLRLTLSDHSSRNSLSEAMLTALEKAVLDANANSTISVIVFAGEGPAFSAGHNLKELTAHRADPDHGAVYFNTIFARCSALMQAIVEHRCVTIAEVSGLASAAGCQLVASCDLAYGAVQARFCTPGVNIGLFCSTPMVALSRAVNPRFAKEMLYTGDVFDAAYALRAGLINDVLADDALTPHVMKLAENIASKSQNALAHGKPAFDAQMKLPLAEAYDHCATIMAINFMEPSAREGVGAVLEKRKPIWPSHKPQK